MTARAVPTAFHCERRWQVRSSTGTERISQVWEADDDQAMVPPKQASRNVINCTANPVAAGFRAGSCLRAAARKAGSGAKREASRSRVRVARPACRKRDQVFGLAQNLFQTPGTNLVCRTSIAGTFETGQSAVRIDLIEREGDKAARLRLSLPVGLYLQAGAKITIDGGTASRIPYVWCLTNTCVAADLADPGLLKEMESGKILALEVVDSSLLTVSTSVPLNQFATVRQGSPSQTFERAIDE